MSVCIQGEVCAVISKEGASVCMHEYKNAYVRVYICVCLGKFIYDRHEEQLIPVILCDDFNSQKKQTESNISQIHMQT